MSCFGRHTAVMTATQPSDPRPLFARAVDTGGSVISGVHDDQWDDPTPCDEFTVRQLCAHLVDVLSRVTALSQADDPFGFPPAAQQVTGNGWLAAWRTAARAVQAAWADDAVLERTMTLPWASAAGRDMLATYLSEVTVHTWDLARATEQSVMWDEAVVSAALAAARRALPGEGRAERFEQLRSKMPPHLAATVSPPFAEAVPVTDGAPLIDQLVAWNGRHP